MYIETRSSTRYRTFMLDEPQDLAQDIGLYFFQYLQRVSPKTKQTLFDTVYRELYKHASQIKRRSFCHQVLETKWQALPEYLKEKRRYCHKMLDLAWLQLFRLEVDEETGRVIKRGKQHKLSHVNIVPEHQMTEEEYEMFCLVTQGNGDRER